MRQETRHQGKHQGKRQGRPWRPPSALPVILVLLSLLLGAGLGVAQPLRLESGTYPQRVSASGHRWLDLDSSLSSVSRQQLLDELSEALLKPDSTLAPTREWVDSLGQRHTVYRQEVGGVWIEGAELMLHEVDGRVVAANGLLIGQSLDPHPDLPGRRAGATALAAFAEAVEGLTETTLEIAEMGLIFARLSPTEEGAGPRYRLSWKVRVEAEGGQVGAEVFVDATSGEILKQRPTHLTCASGTGLTTWHGLRPLHTSLVPEGLFALIDDCSDLHDFSLVTGHLGASNTVTNPDNSWGETHRSEVTAHWAAHTALDYFQIFHGRNSFDGQGGEVAIHNGDAPWGSKNNASWNFIAQEMTLGPGNTDSPLDDWNTIDIVGHELAHGVTMTSALLAYEGESGALNESFSDIFGTAIERFAEQGADPDWLIGEDRLSLPSLQPGIRSLENPGLFDQPKSYKGPHWISQIGCKPSLLNDQCGVHTNSGVQNHWFYLLSEGGFGPQAVTGIGLAKVAAIAYRNLTTYLGSGSGYSEAAAGSVEAAIDLFGACSQEVRSTRDAWKAVNVTPPPYELVGVNGQVCTLDSGVYAALERLDVGGAGCPGETKVGSGENVLLAAGDEVVLGAGFSAALGATVRIEAGSCAP